MKTKNGDSLKKIFEEQKEFQRLVLKMRGQEDKIPQDSVEWFTYHMLAIQEELGEVIKADKRWKTHRNERYVKEEKLDEIADVFITAINIALYSGFDCEEIREAVLNKISENVKRQNELIAG